MKVNSFLLLFYFTLCLIFSTAKKTVVMNFLVAVWSLKIKRELFNRLKKGNSCFPIIFLNLLFFISRRFLELFDPLPHPHINLLITPYTTCNNNNHVRSKCEDL